MGRGEEDASGPITIDDAIVQLGGKTVRKASTVFVLS